MKMITFANSKGGVGKTTLTVGVVRTLAELGKKSFTIWYWFAKQFNWSFQKSAKQWKKA